MATADNIAEAGDLIQRLRVATAGRPADYRPWGSRQGAAPDAAVDKYLIIAVGAGRAFEVWADDERFMDRALVDAAHALIEQMRPPAAAAPARGSAWLQAVSVHEPILTILTRDNQIAALTPAAIAPGSMMARLVALPFSWQPIPAGPFRVTTNIVLSPDNPSAVVRVQNQVFQILFQLAGTSER